MQLPHRPPMTLEEVQLIKARTRQTNLFTWLASLNLGLLFMLIGIPLCLMCAGCLIALMATGVIAVSLPPLQ